RALYSGLEDRRVSLNTYARRNGIPCWNRASLCGFANRRLNCSANGIEIESAGGRFRLRLRCYLVLASLNRSLLANKVRNHCWHRRVETNQVQHSAIVRVGKGEAVGGHSHNDRPRVANELTARTDALLLHRFQHFNVAANPPHEEQRLVFSKQCGRANFGERHRELKAILCCVDEVAIAVVNETDGLVFDEVGDVHEWNLLLVCLGLRIGWARGEPGLLYHLSYACIWRRR